MIRIDTSLFGTPGGIPIGSPEVGLHNPYRLGDTNLSDNTIIRDSLGIQQAYRWWLEWQIMLQNAAVIRGLDMIAYGAMDGSITLNCPCRSPFCHGYMVKEVVEAKLEELNNAH